MSVRDPWLGLIADGRKTVEGRAGPESKSRHLVGGRLTFFNDGGLVPEVATEVVAVRHYPDLYTYLDQEQRQAAPQFVSRDDAARAYHEFYPDRLIAERGGICAIEFKKL